MDTKFFAKVNKLDNGCWEWLGCVGLDGYGLLKRRGISKNALAAHRYSWYLHKGHLSSKSICHTCDNRLCVNPGHLFEGTHEDNMRDMVDKGRSVRCGRVQLGSLNSNSKLTEEDVKVILGSSPSKTNKELGVIFGVSHSTISSIRLGKTWNKLV